MVTTPEAPEAPPTKTDKAEQAVRVLIAGHPAGAVRRLALYAVALVGVLLWPPLAAVALLLLAATDKLA